MEELQAKQYYKIVKIGTDEESNMLQLFNYAIKHGGSAIFNGSDSFDVRTMMLAEEFPTIANEADTLHHGWSNMQEAHFVDFYDLSCADRPTALGLAGFHDETIYFWKSNDLCQFRNKYTSAIHLEMTDGSWFDLFFNQTRPEDHFITHNISVHVAIERPVPSMTARATITSNGERELFIEGPQRPTREMLRRYVCHPTISQAFNQMEKKGETERVWDDTKLFESIILKVFLEDTKRLADLQVKQKKNISNQSGTETKIIREAAKQPTGPLSLNDIKSFIRNNKGYHFSYQFRCRLCKTTHSSGYTFYIEDEEVDICKYCYDEIKQKKGWGKEILVNMGGRR